jgi:nitrite reductase/ring-hydroxylating ferredoxin subunit
MLDETAVTADIEAMAHESRRTEYPSHFPALSEIPGGRYMDERFYRLEMQHIWPKSWLCAGHVCQLPEPGSYKLFDKLGQSIIVIRGRDDEIRAFHNVCRHRGAALVTESMGKKTSLVCPYHSWNYNLDGRLAVVPGEHNFACLDKSKRGLIPVRCETWRGLIFINLDNEAKGVKEHLASFSKRIGSFPLDKMNVKRTLSFEIPCNWKAAYDNFIEIYHIPSVHGQTAMHWLKPETFIVTLLENGHSCLSTERRCDDSVVDPKATAQLLHGPSPDDAPIVPGADKFLDNHTWVCPVFPTITFGGLNPGGFILQFHWPIGPDKCEMEILLLGREDSSSALPYWDDLLSAGMVQINEDLAILGHIQNAFKTGYYTGSMPSYLERAIYWYHEHIDLAIGPDNILPELQTDMSQSIRFPGRKRPFKISFDR